MLHISCVTRGWLQHVIRDVVAVGCSCSSVALFKLFHHVLPCVPAQQQHQGLSLQDCMTVTRSCAHTLPHSQKYTITRRSTSSHVHAHIHTLWRLLQKSHVLQEPQRGEERRMTSSDISISVRKDTTALKVSRCAVCTAQIKSPDLSQKLHQASLNT